MGGGRVHEFVAGGQMPMLWLRTRQVDRRRIQRQLDQGLFGARSSKLDSEGSVW
jgi:hypothetical protein